MPLNLYTRQFARCLFDNAGDAMLVLEPPEAAVIDANTAAVRLTGYDRPRLLQATFSELVAADTGVGAFDFSQVWRNGATWSCCDGWHLRKTDGSGVPVEVQIHRLDTGTESLGVAILRDVTNRKQVEAKLKECECKFGKLFAAAPDAIFIEDLEGKVLDVNPAACRLHGCEREELVGKDVLELVPQNRRGQVRREFARLVSGEIDTADGYSLAGNGNAVPVELRVAHIDYQGMPALLLHVRDVTERWRAEREAKLGAVAAARTSLLSPREREVMELVVSGKTNRTIAEELAISVKTVECHRANMMRKVGVKTVAELVRLVLSAQQAQSGPGDDPSAGS